MKNAALLLISLFSITTFSQLWQHDFSNSGDWISADLNGGSDAWIISSSAIGGSVDSISSATAGNGFAQFNSEGQCNGNHQDVTLTYFQQIDLSANALSYVEFVQHYRRKSDTVYVEFSNDGLTWESIRINKEYWYYQQTQDPDTVQVSIPSSVHSQPFWMRFRFSGECGFAWLMDDVKIFEKAQYNLKVNGKITMNELGYIEIAHCFSDTIDEVFYLENFGIDTLFSVIIQSSVYKNGILEMIVADTVDQINPLQDTIFLQNDLVTNAFYYWENFLVYTKIFNNSLDTIMLTDSILISNTSTKTYSGDHFGNYLSDTIVGIGNLFVCPDFLCPMEPKFYVPNDPLLEGQLVWSVIYKKENSNWIFMAQSSDYEITGSDIGSWAGLFMSNFGDYPLFFPGDTGLVFYLTYYNNFPIPYSEEEIPGSYFYDYAGNLIFEASGHNALIELNPFGQELYDCSTCWESLAEHSVQSIHIYPNPVIDKIQLQNLNQPVHSIKIFSLDGREVYSEVLPDSEIISVSNLQNGTYLIFVETEDGTVYSEKFVKL